MDEQQKAWCLFDKWEALIETIAHFEYDCSFEWRGETDGSHDSYLEDIRRIRKEAEAVLREAVSVEGADRGRILEKAGEVCRRWEETGGWGSVRCWKSIGNATQNGKIHRANDIQAHGKVKKAASDDSMNLRHEKEPAQPDRERTEKNRKAVAFVKEKRRFEVYVEENAHYSDAGERYFKGGYDDCQAAVSACRQIVDDFLKRACSEDKTESQLWREYTQYGEDPFIAAAAGEEECRFSAWDYAKERIKELVAPED